MGGVTWGYKPVLLRELLSTNMLTGFLEVGGVDPLTSLGALMIF